MKRDGGGRPVSCLRDLSEQAHEREGRGADAQAPEEGAPADRRHGEPRRVKPGPFT